MSYLVLDDTLTGTAGVALTGFGGSPVQSAADVWGTFPPFPALVYKSPVGVTSATFSGTTAVSTYPLTGVAQDQDISISFTNTGTDANALIQFHRTEDGNNCVAITVDFFSSQAVNILSLVGGTAGPVTSDHAFGPLVGGTPYTLRIVTAGTAITVATLNGVDLPLIRGFAIPAGTGTVLLIGQSGGPAGDLLYTRAEVWVAGPTTATVTGPPTLVVGVPSSDYTITLNAACPAGGRGIFFDPTASVFSATPTPTTVTIASGETSGTFTETSSTTGAGTVSATSPGITVTGQAVTSSDGTVSSTVAYPTSIRGLAAGLIGGVTAGFGYKLSIGGGPYGTLQVANIAEDSPGSYSAQPQLAPGLVVKARWFDGSGSDDTDYWVVPAASVAVLDLGMLMPPPRALDTVPDAQITFGDALWCAVADAAGKAAYVGTSYVVMTPFTGTVIRTFTTDDAQTPTLRD